MDGPVDIFLYDTEGKASFLILDILFHLFANENVQLAHYKVG